MAKKHKKSRSKKKGFAGTIGLVLGSMVYGAGRDVVSDKLAPLTAKVPAGDLADEVVMGLLSWAVSKGKIPLINKIPLSREIGKAGLTIESARVGNYASNRIQAQKQIAAPSQLSSGQLLF